MELLKYKDVAQEVLKPLSYDFEWPWPILHNATNGMRRRDLILVIGASGLGKSEFTLDVAFDMSTRQGKNVLIISTEQTPSITYRRMISKKLGIRIDLPKHNANRDHVNTIGDSLNIYTFKTAGILDWNILQPKLKRAIYENNIDMVIIDNLSSISAAFKHGKKTLAETLGDTTLAIKELANETNTVIFLVSHVSRRAGIEFDKGGQLSLSDVRSSEGPAQTCDAAFGIERNALSTDPDIRNFSVIRCLKEKMYGQARGKEFYFKYDFNSCSFIESPKLECKIDTNLLLETLYGVCIEPFNNTIKEFKDSGKSYTKFFEGKTSSQTQFEANFKLGATNLHISSRSRPSIIFDAPYVLEGNRSFRRFAEKVQASNVTLKWFMKNIDLANQRMLLYFDTYEEFRDTMIGLIKLFDINSVYMGEKKIVPSFFGDYDAGIKMHFSLINTTTPIERPMDYLEGHLGTSSRVDSEYDIQDIV